MNEGAHCHRERNIMILFLSNLHYENMPKEKGEKEAPRRIFSQKAAPYEIYGPKTEMCIETNEAPLLDTREYLKADNVEHHSLDAVFYFVTDKVRNCNEKGDPGAPIEIYRAKEDAEPSWIVPSEEEFFWGERVEALTKIRFPKASEIDKISSGAGDMVWRIPVSFKEKTGDPSANSLKAVNAMEEAIKKYLKHENVPLNKCNIYADTTGGYRPANMAMSAVMQLLVYQGANLRRVVYSDGKKVFDVQPINDMYRLVAGVDAFTKYGSSAAMNEYFQDLTSGEVTSYPPLKNLLKEMNDFSESVMLCQPTKIEKNLEELMTALKEFPKKTGEGITRPPKVELFARMIDELEEKYAPMYSETGPSGHNKADRLEIIKWCVDNSLLQQAVTFCTEWLPEFFAEHGVIYADDLEVQYCCGKECAHYRSGVKNLVMEFCTQSLAARKKKRNKKKKNLRYDEEDKDILLLDFMTEDGFKKEINKLVYGEAAKYNIILTPPDPYISPELSWQKLPKEFVSKLTELIGLIANEFETFQEKVKTNLNNPAVMQKTVENDSLLLRYLRFLQNNRSLFPNCGSQSFPSFVMRREKIKLIAMLTKISLQDFGDFLCRLEISPRFTYDKNKEEKLYRQQTGLYEIMGPSALTAAAVSGAMLDCGVIKSDLEKEEMLYWVREYTYIRAILRNRMNHAGETKKKKTSAKNDSEEKYVPVTAAGIKGYLQKLLKRLQPLKQRTHTLTGLWAKDFISELEENEA